MSALSRASGVQCSFSSQRLAPSHARSSWSPVVLPVDVSIGAVVLLVLVVLVVLLVLLVLLLVLVGSLVVVPGRASVAGVPPVDAGSSVLAGPAGCGPQAARVSEMDSVVRRAASIHEL
jgi:hypothetical protein